MTLTEEQKKKILWVRSLLKANAPLVYDRYKALKLYKQALTLDKLTPTSVDLKNGSS